MVISDIDYLVSNNGIVDKQLEYFSLAERYQVLRKVYRCRRMGLVMITLALISLMVALDRAILVPLIPVRSDMVPVVITMTKIRL